MLNFKKYLTPRTLHNVGGVLLLLAFAGIGTFLLNLSHAATVTITAEPENGTITGSAATGTDANASNGRYVVFKGTSTPGVSAANPCVHAAAPAAWKHVVVLMFENKSYSNVIGSSSAPYITGLANKCGSYANWHDANFKVDGSNDGSYNSKPNYATLTSGVPPTVHGLTSDSYATTSNVDNIFNRLRVAGMSTKAYESGTGGSCATSNFSGAYHDAMRYYTDLGGHSSSSTTFCNQHDVPIGNFTSDLGSGNLPAFSFVLPTNDQNMHNNTISSGDSWAQNFLDPLFNSAQYKSGDTAVFFLWDENTPIPDVLIAPSIAPGSHPATPTGNPISHFSALRTWQEMLGISPLLGNTGQAPSLLNYYDGR